MDSACEVNHLPLRCHHAHDPFVPRLAERLLSLFGSRQMRLAAKCASLCVCLCVCVSVTKSVGELEFANFFRWLVETCLPNPHVRLSSSSRGTMSREPTHQTSLRMSSTKKMEQRSALRTPYWGRKYFGLKPGGLQPGRVLGDAALRFGLGWRLVTDLSGIPCYLSVSSSKFTTPT